MRQERNEISRRLQMKTSILSMRQFLNEVKEQVRAELPAGLRDFQVSASRSLLKIHYGHHRLHYEVWANARDGHIELGLHFEDSPESTERLIAFFDPLIVEIKHELGPQVELERWTPSWGHIYQLLPSQPPTRLLVRVIAGHLVRMITVLQPLLDQADRPAAPINGPESRA
jgi:hypothetical protein